MVTVLDSPKIGQRLPMVFSTICYNSEGNWHLVQSQDRRGLRIWIQGTIPKGATIAGVELLVTSVQPLRLAVDSSSVLVPVPVCERPALYRILDLCCGLGGFTVSADRLGFAVRASPPPWAAFFLGGVKKCKLQTNRGDPPVKKCKLHFRDPLTYIFLPPPNEKIKNEGVKKCNFQFVTPPSFF